MNTYLSDRQIDYLRAIAKIRRETGNNPTCRELGAACGVHFSTTQQAMAVLRHLGMVTWKHGCARTLQLTEAGAAKINE